MRLVIVESPFAPQTPLPENFDRAHDYNCNSMPPHDDCAQCRTLLRRAQESSRNARYLDACLLDCLRRGEAPFASHGLYARRGVLDDLKPGERELGIWAGFAWRRVAHATIVYTDLGTSNGMLSGIVDVRKVIFSRTILEKLLNMDDAARVAARTIIENLPNLTIAHSIEYRSLGPDWDASRK